MAAEALGPLCAHLWYARIDRLNAGLFRAYEALLTPEERGQHERYRFEHSRHEYLLTRAMVRTVLSSYADVPLQDWQFERGSHGKPRVKGPLSADAPSFNLSNTRGMVVCLVARDIDVGVDAESVRPLPDLLDIAQSQFAPSEVAALRALPAEDRPERFYTYWTLKESYIKARGLGLAIPLGDFAFDVEHSPIGISFQPKLPDDPALWQFGLLRPTEEHRIAYGLRRGRRPDLALVVRETVPLAT